MCKGMTVECMTVRHFVDKGAQKLEVWMGSGLSGDRSGQVSWLNLTDRHAEVTSVVTTYLMGVGWWWMGSGLLGDRSGQVSWLNLMDRHTGNKCRYYVPYGGGWVVDGQWAVGRQEWPGVLVEPHA